MFAQKESVLLLCTTFMMSGLTYAAEVPSYNIYVTVPVIEEGQYHRPYISLWVENDKRIAQRSLAVWMQKSKWLPDLKRYWRRVARKNRDIVDGVTSATKGPGRYTVKWDGLNDKGKPLEAGNYSICLEAAREKGGREVICTPIDYGKTPHSQVNGKHELTQLTVKLN